LAVLHQQTAVHHHRLHIPHTYVIVTEMIRVLRLRLLV
jgi:hypothetical protein